MYTPVTPTMVLWARVVERGSMTRPGAPSSGLLGPGGLP